MNGRCPTTGLGDCTRGGDGPGCGDPICPYSCSRYVSPGHNQPAARAAEQRETATREAVACRQVEKEVLPVSAASEVVCRAIAKIYLESGTEPTTADVAKEVGHSAAWVRKAIVSVSGGLPEGIFEEKESRPSYSRSYRFMEAGAHTVIVYGLTRRTMREIIMLMQDGPGRAGVGMLEAIAAVFRDAGRKTGAERT